MFRHIEATVQRFTNRARFGNGYVNRNQIGTVRAQSFQQRRPLWHRCWPCSRRIAAQWAFARLVAQGIEADDASA
jgi:hypothetical protein